MGIPTRWGGTGNGGTGVDWGIYFPPSEHGCTIHCDPSYHVNVFGRGEESGNAPIQAMVGAARPGYPGYQGGACIHGGGGRRQGRKNYRHRERDSRAGVDDG